MGLKGRRRSANTSAVPSQRGPAAPATRAATGHHPAAHVHRCRCQPERIRRQLHHMARINSAIPVAGTLPGRSASRGSEPSPAAGACWPGFRPPQGACNVAFEIFTCHTCGRNLASCTHRRTGPLTNLEYGFLMNQASKIASSSTLFATPLDLYRSISRVWSGDTSSPSDAWSQSNPARNHCSITSLVVQDHFGGEILSTRTSGGTHFYNQIDGKKWDLTVSQFAEPVPYDDTLSSRDAALADTSQQKYELLTARLKQSIQIPHA